MGQTLQIDEGLFTGLWEYYFKRKRLFTKTAVVNNLSLFFALNSIRLGNVSSIGLAKV